MWKLDSIAPVGPIRRMIAQEAGESDVLMIAATVADDPDPAISGWLDTLVNWKLNRSFPGLLVGLMGNEERSLEPSHWLVGQLAQFAKRTGMDFVWHRMDRELSEDCGWLQSSMDRLMKQKGVDLQPAVLTKSGSHGPKRPVPGGNRSGSTVNSFTGS